jgi:hypothetical protein
MDRLPVPIQVRSCARSRCCGWQKLSNRCWDGEAQVPSNAGALRVVSSYDGQRLRWLVACAMRDPPAEARHQTCAGPEDEHAR